MRIFFYAPFKPLDHTSPSGDWVIGTGLWDYLAAQGHRMETPSRFRSRWVYWQPWTWPRLVKELLRAIRRVRKCKPDLWFTYHSYYKGPDLLGPVVRRKTGLPYVIFQGVYSSKRKKKIRTRAGYALNKLALMSAQHVFTNKTKDLINLRRILPHHRISYVPPGIYPEDFSFDASARDRLRQLWRVENTPVILTAAMFRPGVKTRGLIWVIQACEKLARQKKKFHLVIVGDGKEREKLMRLARRMLPGRVCFTGKIPRKLMHQYYSAGDIFAFPGFKESLGMVFLEAQSCGLPVVAMADEGIPEVVRGNVTGFLIKPFSLGGFVKALDKLLDDPLLRRQMGRAACQYVKERHDLHKNYRQVETLIRNLAGNRAL
ncbi:MAG: glycosyltransferase family 4 protein [Desulfobacterales bacterium]|nr:glycosyltransferase family 4 protein [Desulfobacterales bacterium]